MPAARGEALKFFAWAYAKGDKMAEDLDYVPMPDKVVDAIQKVWASEIKDAERQAAVRDDELTVLRMRKGRRRGALPGVSVENGIELACAAAAGRLSGLPRRSQPGAAMQSAGRRTVADVALQAGRACRRRAVAGQGAGTAAPWRHRFPPSDPRRRASLVLVLLGGVIVSLVIGVDAGVAAPSASAS